MKFRILSALLINFLVFGTAAAINLPNIIEYHPKPPVIEQVPLISKDLKETPSVAVESLPVANNILSLINQERVRAGVAPLTEAADLTASATRRSQYLASNHACCSHDGWLTGFPNYTYKGENLAACQASDAALVKAWVDSPTHYENMIRPNFTHFGIGIAYGDWVAPGGFVWKNCRFATNHFGG